MTADPLDKLNLASAILASNTDPDIRLIGEAIRDDARVGTILLEHLGLENSIGHSALAEARRDRRNRLIARVAGSLPPGSPRQKATVILDAARPHRHSPRGGDFAELVEELRKHPLGVRQLENLIPKN